MESYLYFIFSDWERFGYGFVKTSFGLIWFDLPIYTEEKHYYIIVDDRLPSSRFLVSASTIAKNQSKKAAIARERKN